MSQIRVGGEFNRDFSEDFWIGELVERAIRKQILDGLVRTNTVLSGSIKKSMVLDGTAMPKLVVSGEVTKQDYIDGSILEVERIKVFEKEES